MLQDIDLRALAEVRGNGRDVISAYFHGRDGLKALAARQRKLRELLEDDPLESENFEQSMEMIRELLTEHSVAGAEGVCFFSSAVLDFVQGYPISMSVPDQLYVGPAPYIRPLAELQDEYETFALVECDNDRTRIFTVTNETADVEQAIRGGVKNHVRKGGWSQQRYERRRDMQLARYADEVVAALRHLVERHPIHRIVLIGSSETMHEIEQEMDEPLRDRLVGTERFDLDRPQQEMVERAYESYFDDERHDEQDLWQRIKSEMMRGGRAATGSEEVLQHAQTGRVEAAIVTRDAKLPAAMCRDCEAIHAGEPDSCHSCGSSNTFPIDLIDALARQLELTSARLDFADPVPGLTKAGDVAALLRY